VSDSAAIRSRLVPQLKHMNEERFSTAGPVLQCDTGRVQPPTCRARLGKLVQLAWSSASEPAPHSQLHDSDSFPGRQPGELVGLRALRAEARALDRVLDRALDIGGKQARSYRATTRRGDRS